MCCHHVKNLRPKSDEYLSLHLRPKTVVDVWYGDTQIGVHKLQQYVAQLCEETGFCDNYTNHFLHATRTSKT